MKKYFLKIAKPLEVSFDYSKFQSVILTPAFVIFLAAFFSILAEIVSYKLNLIVAYNDARAHLDMARLVFDNLKPGLAQIGSVWLPLNHLLTLLLVWNNTMWQTGLAGSIFSMLSFVFCSIIIYKFANHIVNDKSASLLGTLVFMTNLNILYMQSTPMTELLLIFLSTLSSYLLYKWVEGRKILDLVYLSFTILLATLTRYDAWFLLVYISFVVITTLLYTSSSKKYSSVKLFLQENWPKVEGGFIFFATAAFAGIGLWLLWNLLIFKDPLFFATGPFSAKVQQDRIAAAGSLPTKHNITLSILAYWWAIVNNAGFLIAAFSIIGFILFFLKNKLSLKSLAVYSLVTPVFFHIFSLFSGNSILILPELGANITKAAAGSWFNVRYGLVILPAVSLFSAYIAKRLNFTKLILFILILIQPLIFIGTKNIITVTDGTVGSSSLAVGDASNWLVANAKNQDGLILNSISYHNALAFSTGIPLKRFIHEGTGDKYWKLALSNPEKIARWIVIENGDVGDPVYEALVKIKNSEYLKYYELKGSFHNINIYELKRSLPGFVYTLGTNLKEDNKTYQFVGVNSYDLMYRPPEEIDETLSTAHDAGIKVVRFWAFGNGREDGTQLKAGTYNEKAYKNIDLIIETAKKYDIKLILTISNYWDDYGGVHWYLATTGNSTENADDFFTNEKAKDLFKHNANKLVSRVNSISHIPYSREPVIMAWELMNEPRATNLQNARFVNDWTAEMALNLKSQDPNHMILGGTEGFLRGSKYTTQDGPMFEDATNIDNIAAASAHFYKHGDKYKFTNDFDFTVLADWKTLSDIFTKPFILGEIGFFKDPAENDGVKREVLYNNLFNQAHRLDLPGIILWNWALKRDDSFGISPLDPGDSELIKIIRNYSKSLSK